MHIHVKDNSFIILQGHLRDECPMAEVSCPHKGCSEVIVRSKIDDHMQQCLYNSQWSDQVASSNSPLNSPKHLMAKEKSAPQPCCFEFLGCKFVGSDVDLSVHMEKDTHSHLGLVCKHLLNTSFHKQINGFNRTVNTIMIKLYSYYIPSLKVPKLI